MDKHENIEQLYDEYGERVFNAVFCMLGRYQDAEDITQETFVSAHRRWDEFEGRSSPYTWLYRIAMNAAKTHLKKNARRARLLCDIGAEAAEQSGTTGTEDEVERRFFEDEATSGDGGNDASSDEIQRGDRPQVRRRSFIRRHLENHRRFHRHSRIKASQGKRTSEKRNARNTIEKGREP